MNGFRNIMKQALEIRKTPFPWSKAINAGICSALPPLIGLLMGNLQYGLLAGIGGFTYLYMFNEPYAQRAKKLFFVMLGMTIVVGLGSLLASSPFIAAVLVGIIGALAIFTFGALKIPGPSAVFLVLGFVMSTAMPSDPAHVPLRMGLILIGGVFSWVVGMVGWLFKKHGPEIIAVHRVYQSLASLMDSVGSEKFNEERKKSVLVLRGADDTLLAGYSSLQFSDLYKRLYQLQHQANAIFLDVLQNFSDGRQSLPSDFSRSLRTLADSIGKTNSVKIIPLKANYEDEAIRQLSTKINEAHRINHEEILPNERQIDIYKPSIGNLFEGAFDKNSIVFLNSLRYGLVLTLASIIAFSFDFTRSYWIPLSCAAVMLGSTVMATFHRAIQRTIGTIIGVIVASIILSMNPTGIVIVVFILLMTFLTELFIVKNYAIAVMFITPNALLITETITQIHKTSYFATARIMDILIGCVIGLLGTLLVGRRSASSRLPHVMAKTIRSQIQLIVRLFHSQKIKAKHVEERKQRKMQTNLTNLQIVYTTTLGEIPNNRVKVGFLQPAISSIEHIGFLLEAYIRDPNDMRLSDEALAQLLLVFENMALAVEHHQSPMPKAVPNLDGFTSLQKEIMDLQEALQVVEKCYQN